jgi:formylglycine-generating enzyme required for sulfatase activity
MKLKRNLAIVLSISTVLLCSVFTLRINGSSQEKTTEGVKKMTNASDKPKEIIGKDGAKMVLIPAGEFQMGIDPAEIPELVQLAKQYLPDVEAIWFECETPRHTVRGRLLHGCLRGYQCTV